MRDVNAEILRLALGFFAPDRPQQLSMRHYFPCVLNENAEQRVFGWRQFDFFAVELDLTRREIDAERSRAENQVRQFQ